MFEYFFYRSECFTNIHFKSCLEALQYTDDEIEELKWDIKLLNGAEPPVSTENDLNEKYIFVWHKNHLQ